MSLELVETSDGSLTLFDANKNVHYRSTQGARTESEYVFLESSGLPQHQGTWRVLELGLGVGWNFLVTAKAAMEAETPLDYHAVEYFPLKSSTLQSVHPTENHPAFEVLQKACEASQNTHSPQRVESGPVKLTIYPMHWQAVTLPTDFQAQAVYHDPFGIKDNPECWTKECFAWELAHLAPEGRLVTYAAASQVRKAMAQAGLYLATQKGSGTKREMTLAARSQEVLGPLKPIRREKYL